MTCTHTHRAWTWMEQYCRNHFDPLTPNSVVNVKVSGWSLEDNIVYGFCKVNGSTFSTRGHVFFLFFWGFFARRYGINQQGMEHWSKQPQTWAGFLVSHFMLNSPTDKQWEKKTWEFRGPQIIIKHHTWGGTPVPWSPTDSLKSIIQIMFQSCCISFKDSSSSCWCSRWAGLLKQKGCSFYWSPVTEKKKVSHSTSSSLSY